MLQPLEELQNCNAKAEKSINLDYSSLPPQLVVVKAVRSKHFVLAAVCTMGLLANILAVAFAGLFRQDAFDIGRPTVLQAPFNLKFVPIDGSVGPDTTQTMSTPRSSGAYKGGEGQDQFLVSESNYTSNTPLPAWTDDKLFYLPFVPDDAKSTNASTFEAVTQAFGAEMDCSNLEIGSSFQAAIRLYPNGVKAVQPTINITLTKGTSEVQCTGPSVIELRPGPIGNQCSSHKRAAELVLSLHPRRANASQAEVDTCRESVVLGWLRSSETTCGNVKGQALTNNNATFLLCKPKWVTGTAKIRVDITGRLQAKAREVNVQSGTNMVGNASAFSKLFSNDPINLIGQSNLYLLQGSLPGWHNDSFANDFLNYFMIRASNSSDLVSPLKPIPAFDNIVDPLNKAYSSLFAIWIGLNKEKLLVAHDTQQPVRISGLRIETETRLFVSTPMFVISEVILCTYVIVAILVYLRRPGQYLPRMPTNIASVIALFAASSAVEDLQNTSHLNKGARARHLEALDSRYGYGSFVGGGDGRVHIGIEKTPFVRLRSKTTWLEKRVPLLRKGSAGTVLV